MRLCLLLAVALAVACPGGGDHEYGPGQDTKAMKHVLGSWSTADTNVLLSLNEDVEMADEAAANQTDCSEDHIVRPGRGEDHVVDHGRGIGCGGCQFDVMAYVQGELRNASSPEPVQLRGEVQLGDGYQGEPYALPYTIWLSTVDYELVFSGEVDRQGVLRLSQTAGPDLQWGEIHLRLNSGAATSPEA